jgi:hypothetical protein
VTDGKLNTMTAIGSLKNKEMPSAKTTPKLLKPVTDVNTGIVLWSVDAPKARIRRIDPDRRAAGSGRLGGGRWIGLCQNGDLDRPLPER